MTGPACRSASSAPRNTWSRGPQFVVGRALGVKTERFGSSAEQRRRVPEPGEGIVKQRAHRLGVELARPHRDPGTNVAATLAMMPSPGYPGTWFSTCAAPEVRLAATAELTERAWWWWLANFWTSPPVT